MILRFSLIIFFDMNEQEYNEFFEGGFLLLVLDIFSTFNTGILFKGGIINKRREIAINYFKGNFMLD